jgi:glutaredoxin
VTQANQTQFILYTHPDCAFSAAAKMDYRKRKVDFVEIDVSKQKDKVAELEQLTGGERITPVMIENGNVIIGFKGNT